MVSSQHRRIRRGQKGEHGDRVLPDGNHDDHDLSRAVAYDVIAEMSSAILIVANVVA